MEDTPRGAREENEILVSYVTPSYSVFLKSFTSLYNPKIYRKRDRQRGTRRKIGHSAVVTGSKSLNNKVRCSARNCLHYDKHVNIIENSRGHDDGSPSEGQGRPETPKFFRCPILPSCCPFSPLYPYAVVIALLISFFCWFSYPIRVFICHSKRPPCQDGVLVSPRSR